MTFLLTLICSTIAVVALRPVIRKVPWAFYALAVAVVVLFFAGTTFDLPRDARMAMVFMMQKCMLATALFVIVMYIGLLPKDTKARRWMQPLRGPVSIVACILALGHMVRYFMTYITRIMGGGTVASNVMLSFVIAIVLFALLIVLGVTSFNFIKKRMSGYVWKRVQWFAYVFYALVYVHLLIMLGPAALAGGKNALVSAGIYTVVFGAYLALRLVKMRKDKAAGVVDDKSDA